jgi:DNA-binding winged helix-turn-helix (wHTH) protein
MASPAFPASIDATGNPAPNPAPTDPSHPSPAQVLLSALLERTGRVVTRTELARVLGLRTDQTRRIDAMLVEVRRELTQQGLELVNVRSRGWMISDANHS